MDDVLVEPVSSVVVLLGGCGGANFRCGVSARCR